MRSRVLYAAILACSLSPRIGFADNEFPWVHTWSICGGTEFLFCADVTAELTHPSMLFLRVRNNSGMYGTYNGAAITRIGLMGLPFNDSFHRYATWDQYSTIGPANRVHWWLNRFESGGRVEEFGMDPHTTLLAWSNYYGYDPLSGSIASSCGRSILPDTVDLFVTPTCGWKGLELGPWGTGVYPYMEAPDGWTTITLSEDWNTARIPMESFNNLRLYVDATDVTDRSRISYFRTDQPETITTPEPVSLALFGSGLLAIGLARSRRRRRRE